MARAVAPDRAIADRAEAAPREHAKYVVQAPAEAAERRRKRWLRRRTYQRFLDWQAGTSGGWEGLSGRRQAGCGRCGWSDQIECRGRFGDDGTYAYPVGVQTCGSVWACCPCMAKIRARRSLEVEAAAAAHVAAGGTLAMVTLTLRHHREHSLADLMTALRESYRTLQQHRRWRPFRAGLVGSIVSLEITQGPNGWHPHLHVLLFLSPGQSLGDLHEWVPRAWASIVGRRLGVSPDLAHGTRLQMLDAGAAQYVAKIADEHTRSDLKGDSRSPWALLDAMDDGEAEAIAQWLEYVSATKGKRAIVWSVGLRKALLGDDEELTDEQIAEQEQDGVVLDVIDSQRWFRMAMTLRHGVVEAVHHLEQLEARGSP